LKRNRLQLWGEAAKYEAEGESIVLDKKLWPAVGEEQEKRRVKDPWEDILNNIPTHVYHGLYGPTEFSYAKKGDDVSILGTQIRYLSKDRSCEMVASADLLKYVLNIPTQQQTNAHGMRVAAVMKRLGWEHGRVFINGGQVKGYRRPIIHWEAKDFDWKLPEPKTARQY
jgi:predicted P-loop ATPase